MRALDSLGLKLQVVVSHFVGTRIESRSSRRAVSLIYPKCLVCLIPSQLEVCLGQSA